MKKKNARVAGIPVGIQAIVNETRMLFHRLKLVAEEIHGRGEMTASMRGVLESLNQSGPQTVPQMARSRPVSRQHIQNVVNVLRDGGLVEYRKNSAHKKSQLVYLTLKGKRTFDRMMKVESRFWKDTPVSVSEDELVDAAAILRKVRQFVESGKWKGQRLDRKH